MKLPPIGSLEKMKHSFEMTDDQVDAIIIHELKEAYRMNSYGNTDEGGFNSGPDEEFLSAIEMVLEYFMSPGEFTSWKETGE